jgi:hypothetical protein
MNIVLCVITGLYVLMPGAAVTHARRREVPNVVVNLALGLLAAGVAVRPLQLLTPAMSGVIRMMVGAIPGQRASARCSKQRLSED